MDALATAIFLLMVVVLTSLARPLVKYAIFKYKFRNVNGPKGLPFVGNILNLGKDGASFFKVFSRWCNEFREQGFFIMYFGMRPLMVIMNPDDMEKVLLNTKLDTKGYTYDHMKPWLGDGLLISSGPKWAKRRKLLTPSFHFTILNKFVHVFNEQAECLADKLCRMADGRTVDIAPLVTLCTLDIICETIMGLKLESQKGKGTDYVAALHRLGRINNQRMSSPWQWNDFLFEHSRSGREFAKCLEALHGQTKKVIKEAKLQAMDNNGNDVIIDDKSREVRKRRRLAFLDLLIEVQKQDPTFTDEGIQEEVDTFMFEGHDTTASSIAFCLYLIGRHPHVQEKIHKELDQVFGGQNGRHLTPEDLPKLEYLSCVVKEAQRLLTPVPYIGREVEEEVHACGMAIPPGVTLWFNLFDLHRDPKHFPNPEVFDPDRFLPANSEGRHHFAFVPFSAGHRNCIGQKFALMEQKIVVATLLKKLKLKSLDSVEDLELVTEMILRSKGGLNMEIEIRN